MAQEPRHIQLDYRPRPQFMPLHTRTQRWGVVVAHRQAGKTVACINELIRSAMTCTKQDGRFAYIAPYYSQAKAVAWNYLKRFSAPIPGIKTNESELHITYPNGAEIRLSGADNYDRLRGLYHDGVVCDEVGDMDPRAWEEAIRPTLAARRGWGLFIGTPKGINHFAKMWQNAQSDPEWFTLHLPASETGLLTQEELDDNRKTLSEEQYQAEYEASFEASVVGAFYGRVMAKAEKDGRICGVPYDPNALVDTWWDLGVDDATAIWFTQTIGREVHVLDYLEEAGEGLQYYARRLKEKPYADGYGTHNAPHDIAQRELGTGKSRLETAAGLGIAFQMVPNIGRADGIDAARAFINKCWFDKVNTACGCMALTSYRKVWDDKRKIFQTAPLHDWASNGADAFRYLAIGHKTIGPKPAYVQSRSRPSSSGDGMDGGLRWTPNTFVAASIMIRIQVCSVGVHATMFRADGTRGMRVVSLDISTLTAIGLLSSVTIVGCQRVWRGFGCMDHGRSSRFGILLATMFVLRG
jgi:phage terminase large subunit